MRAVLLVVSVIAVGLAGCTETEGPSDPGLQAGTGAINGLLVDDRFRPLQLTDDPETDFQVAGFILVQETGKKVQTNENGEFFVLDLEPGDYTLRATIDGHEATPLMIQVSADEYAEASMVARRVVSLDGAIMTQEYVVFIACSITVLFQLNFNTCDADLSGDSDRSSLDTDYSGINNVTNLVVEFKANQEAPFEVDVWWVPALESTEDSLWYASSIFEGDYVKQIMIYGGVSDQADFTDNDPWLNDRPFQTDVLIFGLYSEEASTGERIIFPDDNPLLTGGGVGVRLGVKADLMHSLFLGDPAEPVDSYCLLC